MGYAQFNLAIRGIKVGIVTFALTLQLLPVFFLLLVFAYVMGITGLGMLVMFPLFLIAVFIAACWLTARQVQNRAPWSRARQTPAHPPAPLPKPRRPVKQGVVLIKSREERYRDMLEFFKTSRR